jgi:diguanylate cyclase (GGDEF)-like protein
MQTNSPAILIIEEPDSVESLKTALKGENFQLHTYLKGEDILHKANDLLPDLIIIDFDVPGINGFELCHLLKNKIRLTNVPIIMISSHIDDDYLDKAFEAQIDDYITKPININEFRRRVKSFVEHTKHYMQASPLTGLPGNAAVEYKIIENINTEEIFAVAYIDIDQFKSYNDTYSWLAGDVVIRNTAQIILEALELWGGPNSFLGHLGGDDFIAILGLKDVDHFAETVIEEFDRMIPLQYDVTDQKRGYVIHHDRQGNLYCFPLLSVSVAIVTNESRKFVHAGQVVQIGLELKEFLKPQIGSKYLVNRRQIDTLKQ